MIKIVATADNHLNKYYKKMTPEQLRKRRENLRKAFEEVINFSIKEKVDIFLQIGDLFDMPNPRNTELAFVMEEFFRLKKEGIDIFAVAGTHDSITAPDEDSYPIKIFEKAGILKAFTKTREIEPYIWEKDVKEKILISGLSTDLRIRGRNDPLRDVRLDSIENYNLFKILLLHYSIEEFSHPQAQEPQISKGTLYSFPFDLYIIGHLHEHREHIFGNKRIIIPGATERINFGEEENETGFYFIRIEGKRVFSEYLKINSQPMKTIEIKTSEISPENPTESIIRRIEEESLENQLLKCRISGPLSISIYQNINFSKINRRGMELNFFFDLDTQNLYIRTSELPSISFSEDWNVKRVLEKFTQELLLKEERDREIIKEALNWIKDNLGDSL
ncbi:MAG: metallophosphoesterase family protein [Dictyoglomaceae bacterium]